MIVQQEKHQRGATKSHYHPPRLAAFILWWSGTTTTLLFVLVLRTRLSIILHHEQRIMSSARSPSFVNDYTTTTSHSPIRKQLREYKKRRINPSEKSRSSTSTVPVDNRPTGRFSTTWNFTESQQEAVAPFASVFGPSTWNELHGKKCQSSTYKNLQSLQDYITSLDLYVVSHGGVGSNAVIDHLHEQTSLKVKNSEMDPDSSLYYASCHLGNPAFVSLVRDVQQQQQQQQQSHQRTVPPTLVIVGDFWKSFSSMKRRGWLNMNIAKNLYGAQTCRSKWENSLPVFPHDPAGIKMMMLAHIVAAQQHPEQQNESPIVFLQAPYSKESILQSLHLLLPSSSNEPSSSSSVQRHLDGFEVRQRVTKTTAADAALAAARDDTKDVDPLLELYKPYEKLESILYRMPPAWKASETPAELYEYLLSELSL